MKKAVLLPWNAAAWRQSTYEPRVRKVHGPVGEELSTFHAAGLTSDRPVVEWNDDDDCFKTLHLESTCCLDCGHHVCSCERQLPEHVVERLTYPFGKPEPLPAPEGMLAVFAKPEPREYMSRAALYARKYGVAVPVPAEPTLCIPPHELKLMKEHLERQQRIVPVPPNPGLAGPCCALAGDNWHCDCDTCGFCKMPASEGHDCSRETGPHRGFTP